MHRRKHRDVEAEPARIQQAAIALDVTFFLQRPDPAQARRRRNADALGQFHICDSAVGLDFGEDFEVDLVKILRHAVRFPEALERSASAAGNSLSAARAIDAILLRVQCAISRSPVEKSLTWIAILA